MTEGHSNILYYDLQVVINNEIKPSAKLLRSRLIKWI